MIYSSNQRNVTSTNTKYNTQALQQEMDKSKQTQSKSKESLIGPFLLQYQNYAYSLVLEIITRTSFKITQGQHTHSMILQRRLMHGNGKMTNKLHLTLSNTNLQAIQSLEIQILQSVTLQMLTHPLMQSEQQYLKILVMDATLSPSLVNHYCQQSAIITYMITNYQQSLMH